MQLTTLAVVAFAPFFAEAFSPTNGYAPGLVRCPSEPNFLREATDISSKEQDWLQKRLPLVKKPMQDFLGRVWSDYNDTSIVDEILGSDNLSHVPKIAIAAAGGGYAAMFTGAGMIAALDDRTNGAIEHGLGGVLQSSTYLSALSGGSWLVGSLTVNNFTSVQSILDNTYKKNSIWDITNSIIAPGGLNVFETAGRFYNLFKMAKQKKFAGFPVTITDIWGNALAYNFMPNLPNGGAGTLWSDVRDYDPFKNAEMPFPIILTTARNSDGFLMNPNSTSIEVNPFEFGSWDTSLNAFHDLKYIGTPVINGKPITENHCVAGYDQASFVMGSSSNIFNLQMLKLAGNIINSFLNFFGSSLPAGGAVISQNPFFDSQYTSAEYKGPLSSTVNLVLGDGADINQNVPITPLIQKNRDIDVIFALDTWGSPSNYPTGASLIASYNRQFTSQGKNSAFPPVPDAEEFVSGGYNKKPVFFGCYSEDLTDLNHIPPLVVYLPVADYSYPNPNLLKLAYSLDERIKVIKNGFESATANNLTNVDGFAGCVGCAILRRSQEKLGLELPEECNKCFEELCYRPPQKAQALAAIAAAPTPSTTSINSGQIEQIRSSISAPSGEALSTVVESISAALYESVSGVSSLSISQPTTAN